MTSTPATYVNFNRSWTPRDTSLAAPLIPISESPECLGLLLPGSAMTGRQRSFLSCRKGSYNS
jgi:hypothetical protein